MRGTDADAFVFLSGNSLEGGWGLNYAMVIALGLTVVSFLLRKVGQNRPLTANPRRPGDDEFAALARHALTPRGSYVTV